MILPPVESTPLLLLSFSSRASDRLVAVVSDRLRSEGLIVLSSSKQGKSSHESTVLTVTVSQSSLEEAAESIHLVKRTGEGIMERFTVRDRHRFVASYDNSIPHGPQVIFLACEWYVLAHRILERIKVIPFGEQETELSKLLLEEYQVDCHLRVSADMTATQVLSSRSLRQYQEQSDYLGNVLRASGLIDSVSATHLPALRDHIFLSTWEKWNHLGPPSTEIYSYYGWDVAFYFAWMKFLNTWLVFPAIVGVLVVLLRFYRGDTLDEDEYTPFYGIVTFFWAILFLRFWERKESRLSFKWGTCLLTAYEQRKFFALRPFRGYVRISPITGEPEVFYPRLWRRLKCVGSALVTLLMLSVAFSVMVLSLNLQGYIRPKLSPLRWDESNPHPFHFESLAVLADEGNLFDATSWWRALIPAVIHVACINTLNSIYRTVAEFLTTWENHESELSHQNSYALKRFLFEAFDCYIALFYLAFFERDVERLRSELIAIFQIDTFRRIAAECLLPMLIQRLGRMRPEIPSKKVESSFVPSMISMVSDLDKDEYDLFDDYMEVLIQFGYTILFASAYPLAPLISIASNWIVIRVDFFKLSFLHKRPIPQRSSGLGIWRALLSCLVWMSALTNCLLAGFTSDQLMHYLPSFYIQDRSGFTTLEHDKGWLLVFLIFGLERLLLVVGFFIYVIIPEVPEDVTNELERIHYVHSRQLEERRSSKRLKKVE